MREASFFLDGRNIQGRPPELLALEVRSWVVRMPALLAPSPAIRCCPAHRRAPVPDEEGVELAVEGREERAHGAERVVVEGPERRLRVECAPRQGVHLAAAGVLRRVVDQGRVKAAEAGADAVKFQYIIPEKLISPNDKLRIEQLNGFKRTNECQALPPELIVSSSLQEAE